MNTVVVPVITVDGLSGAGKGTLGSNLAQDLGWHYLDSGALYRLLALAATRQHIPLHNESALADLASMLSQLLHEDSQTTQISPMCVLWQSEDVTHLIRTESYGLKAAQVAAHPEVRIALLKAQRYFRKLPGLVADGRDMGQVIFPQATAKFFLTASLKARAERRKAQLKQQGNYASLNEITRAIMERDQKDQLRLAEALKVIPKACIIDTTCLSVAQVIALVKKELPVTHLYFH